MHGVDLADDAFPYDIELSVSNSVRMSSWCDPGVANYMEGRLEAISNVADMFICSCRDILPGRLWQCICEGLHSPLQLRDPVHLSAMRCKGGGTRAFAPGQRNYGLAPVLGFHARLQPDCRSCWVPKNMSD